LCRGLSLGEIAVLNVGSPSANSSHWVNGGGQRAGASHWDGRDNFDQAGVQRNARQRVAGQVRVGREGPETIGSQQAAAALAQFLVRIEHEDAGADIAAGIRARIVNAERSIWSARGVGVGKIIDLQRIRLSKSVCGAEGQSEGANYDYD